MPTEDVERQYAAFISYPRELHETRCALWLQERLEEYRVPDDVADLVYGASVGRLFVDDTELSATTSLSESIRAALAESRWLIVICSPVAAERLWVNEEIEYFVALGREDRVIPVLVEGSPIVSIPAKLKELALRKSQDPNDLPLALDLRTLKGPTARRAIVRAASLLLGCNFDQLWRRHEERRLKNRRRLLATGSFLLVILVAIAFYGLFQRERRRAADATAKLAIAESHTATEKERVSRSLSHFSRGAASETDRDLDTARLQYSASVAVVDQPEFRQKVIDVWNSPDVRWQTVLSELPAKSSGSFLSCFSGNGTLVWIASSTSQLEVFDASSGKHIHSLHLDHSVKALVEIPGGKRVAVGLDDGTILVVDNNFKVSKTYHLESPISSLAIDSNAHFLAVGMRGNGMTALDLASGVEQWRAPSDQQDSTVYSIAFADQGAHGILGMGRYLYWFDLDNRKFGMLTAFDDDVTSTAWSSTGGFVAAGGLDGPIYVNSSLTQKALGVARDILSTRKRDVPDFWNITGHRGGTATLCFTANGDRIISGGYDGAIRIWNSRTGELILKLAGHTAPVTAISLSPEEDKLVSVDTDGRIITWNVSSDSQIAWSNAAVKAKEAVAGAMGNLAPIGVLATAPNAVVVMLRNQSLWQIGAQNERPINIAGARGSSLQRRPLILSPEQDFYAWISPEIEGVPSSLMGIGEIERRDLHSSAISRWSIPGASAAAPLRSEKWIIGTRAGKVEVRSWGQMTASSTIASRNHPVIDADISRRFAATLWSDDTVGVYDRDGKLLLQFPTQPSSEALKLSSDGTYVALTARGENAVLRIFETGTGKAVFEKRAWASSILFSADDRYFAFGSDNTQEIQILKTADWSSLVNWHQDGHLVSGLAFSEDDNVLYSSGADGVVRRWDLGSSINISRSSPEELWKGALSRSAMTLNGVDAVPKKLSPVESIAISALPTPVRQSDRIVSLVNQLRGADPSSQRAGTEKILARAISECPVVHSQINDLQIACVSGEFALGQMQVQEGQSDAGNASIQGALQRAEFIRQTGNSDAVAAILPVYSNAADLLKDSDPQRAVKLFSTVVETKKKIIQKNPSLDMLQGLSGLLGEVETLLKRNEDKQAIVQFYRDTVAFLESVRHDPALTELAGQGDALYQFKLGDLLLDQKQFADASQALAAADRLYGEQLSSLVLSGNPLANQARQRWASVITTRAIAEASPFLAGEKATAQSKGPIETALEDAKRGLEQVKILEEAGIENNDTAELKRVLRALTQKLTSQLD